MDADESRIEIVRQTAALADDPAPVFLPFTMFW